MPLRVTLDYTIYHVDLTFVILVVAPVHAIPTLVRVISL